MTSLPTTPTIPDRSICQWTQILNSLWIWMWILQMEYGLIVCTLGCCWCCSQLWGAVDCCRSYWWNSTHFALHLHLLLLPSLQSALPCSPVTAVITRHRASTSMYSRTQNVSEYMLVSEYKHVLANILRSRYVARTPPVEACSPGRRSNVENAPRRRPVTGQPATPTSHIWRALLRMPASHRLAARSVPTQVAVCTMSSYRGMDTSL